MKLKTLLDQLEIVSATADPETEILGISYESRKTEKGDLFVAIRGFETDGHRFIPKAIEKKAAVILCETPPEQEVPFIRVRDSRRALAVCSSVFYGNPSARMRMIGITGTSGKTSVSMLLKHVLEETRGAKVGLIGTTGIWIGQEAIPSEFTTPESLELHQLFHRMAEENCSHVVMEVSSHALELSRVAGIEFDTAVYMNLSQDHLDFHGTMENYAAAKKKIFSQCKSAWVNADDSWTPYMTENVTCPVHSFGTRSNAELRAEKIRLYPNRVGFDTVLGVETVQTQLNIPGAFSVSNALAVIAAAYSEGIPTSESAKALATAHGVKGRLESVPTDGNYHILIDYSHKPDALEKVLRTLREATPGRLICVFGCGGDRDHLKRPLMGKIAAELSDLVILTSDNPRTENPESIIDEIEPGLAGTTTPWIRICDRVEAIHRAIDLAGEGDVILLAGKGHEDYQIVGHTKRHMDEREIVADYLKQREKD